MIHRGTDFAVFSPRAVAPERVEALRKAWEVAPHERVVLLAARLTGWKGQKVLIEAAAKLRDAGLTDVAYILAGDPQGRDSYVKDLDSLIEARKLKGIVRRVGHCTDMPAAFLAASVVTVPSTEPEAFGRSAVEAQAMGTPVVVSDLGAVPETVLSPPAVLPHERTGWRIPPGDADALAEALGAALALGRQRQDRLGRPGAGACGASFLARTHGFRAPSTSIRPLLEGRFTHQNKLTSRAFARNVDSFAARLSGTSRDPLGSPILGLALNRRYEPFADQ